MGVIDKRGSYYNYGEQRLAQGRENAKAFLRENPEMSAEIEDRIRETFGLAPSRPLVDDELDDDSTLDE
jgi:recombination protein RecA